MKVKPVFVDVSMMSVLVHNGYRSWKRISTFKVRFVQGLERSHPSLEFAGVPDLLRVPALGGHNLLLAITYLTSRQSI